MENVGDRLNNKIKQLTSFYKDIGSQILKLVVILTTTWILGYFSFSLFWIYLCLFVYVLFFFYKQKHYQLYTFGLEYSRNEKEFIHNMPELASWITFPDVERAEWLNKIILRLWPSVTLFLRKMVETKILPKVQKKLNGLEIKYLTFGESTPRIGGIKIYDDDGMKRDEMFMDLDLYFFSEVEVQASYKKINFGIKNFEFKCRARIHATPLMPKFPFVGALSICFLQNPHIGYEFTDTSVVLSLPFLNTFLRESLLDVIADLMVTPNRIPIKLISDANMHSLMFRLPECVMRIKIIEAKSLKSADVELFGKGNKSDPYVNVRVGASKFKTKVIDNNLNPVWNETFESIMQSSTSQMIELEVYDRDRNNDDFLGRIEIEPKVAYATGYYDKWMELEEVKTGSIHLSLTWLTLSNDPGVFDIIDNSTEVINNPLSTALFYFCLDSAKNLPFLSNNQEPSAYAEISIGNDQKKSSVKKKTQNPTWENQFHFLIQSVYTSKVDITIIDDKTKKILGVGEFKVSELLHVPVMEKFETVHLKSSSTNSTIQVYAALRALLPKQRTSTLSTASSSMRHRPSICSTSAKDTKPLDDKLDSDVVFEPTSDISDGDNDTVIQRRNVEISNNNNTHVKYRSQPESLDIDNDNHNPSICVSMGYNKAKHLLSVHIHDISGLTWKHPCYIKLYLHPKDNRYSKRRTKKISGPNYLFNEKFEFILEPKSMEISNLQLDIKYDRKFVINNNNRIGSTEIDLANINENETSKKWYSVNLKTKRNGDTASIISIKSETSV